MRDDLQHDLDRQWMVALAALEEHYERTYAELCTAVGGEREIAEVRLESLVWSLTENADIGIGVWLRKNRDNDRG